VVELLDATKPQIDTIYVTPPNADVVLEEGLLRLRDPEGHSASPKPSADRLFKSLAAECGEHCVAIVLSGTGSDGSYGVQAVREAGGITIAQDVTTAKYDGMPSSAIETGCIDLTLTPEEMGRHLKKILATPRDFASLRPVNVATTQLSDLMQILLAHSQVDFREYKENTIHRRISRRMVALGIDDYDEYVEFCRNSTAEVEALQKDLLISVTRFFRDPDQFEQLKGVITSLVASRENRQIRVWVAGCATGEEAYSIAVILAEALGGADQLRKTNVQIFASDIDERALEVGRRGIYPSSAAADIPRHLLEKYFEFSAGNIQVIPAVRSVVLFSRHNVAQDPPFINVDLVTLRNILIYFNSTMQERVLRRVHYSLNHNGTLFLGTSEAVGSMSGYFEQREGTDKIFVKRSSVATPALSFAETPPRFQMRPTHATSPARFAASSTRDFEMFEELARSVAPNGFIVTKTDQIVRIFGDISNVIELSEDSVLNMSTRILRPGLRDEASSLISVTLKARQQRAGRWHTLSNDKPDQVRLRAFPISGGVTGEDHVLFAVHYRTDREDQPRLDDLSEEDRIKYVRQVEQEMLSTRETLQQTVEELQTSNEELQSTNEELITVNEEMQVNAAELQRITVELSSIVKYAPYAILVVDHALLVRRVSDKAKSFFNVSELPTAGLHVAQVDLPEGFPPLAPLCNDAFRERVTKSMQIELDERIYSLIVTPFSGMQNVVMGLKVTVVELEVGSFLAMLDAMDELGGIGHWRLNTQTEKVLWSTEVFRMHGLDPSGPQPTLDEAISHYHPDDQARVSAAIKEAIRDHSSFTYEARITRADGHVVPVRVSGKVTKSDSDEPSFVVGAMIDRSDELRHDVLVAQFNDVQDQLDLGFYSYDVENNAPYWTPALYRMLGFDPATHTPTVESAIAMFHEEDRARVDGLVQAAIKSGEGYHYHARLVRQDGTVLPCEGQGRTITDANGRVSYVYGFFRLVPEDV
jgi:chemotaxis protein methyltransferase CheR/two-component system CheB/CheR fusion protein